MMGCSGFQSGEYVQVTMCYYLVVSRLKKTSEMIKNMYTKMVAGRLSVRKLACMVYLPTCG